MIWEKLVLLEWFIRGLVAVNCFLPSPPIFFFLLNFYSLVVLFGFQESQERNIFLFI